MFTTDSRTERFLDSLGVKWRYSNALTFDQLAEKWDAINLGRSQVRIDGAIEEYGALMDKGSAAPAPIVWCNGNRRYEVLDGMQRILAEESRCSSSFSAYIALTDSASIAHRIRVFANYRLQGGYQESSDWTLHRAIELLVNTGEMTMDEVAQIGGWSKSAVREKKDLLDVGAMVRGVGGPEKIPDSIARLLSQHSCREDFASSPVAIAGFCNDIHRMRLSAAEAEAYIEQFFSVARSRGNLFDQFENKLDEFRSDDYVIGRLADPTRLRYQPMTSEGKLLKALKAALTTAMRVRDCRDQIHEMAEYFQIVNQIRTMLQQIERNSRKK